MREPAVAGVIGWPISHSKSPLIHRFWLGKLGLDGDYSRFPVRPEQLGTFVRALPVMGMRGVNVTVPTRRLPARSVQMLPMVSVVQADVHDPQQLAALVRGHDAVVNLVAILHGNRAAFEQVHVV